MSTDRSREMNIKKNYHHDSGGHPGETVNVSVHKTQI